MRSAQITRCYRHLVVAADMGARSPDGGLRRWVEHGQNSGISQSQAELEERIACADQSAGVFRSTPRGSGLRRS